MLSLAIRGYTPPVRGNINGRYSPATDPVSNTSAPVSRSDLVPWLRKYEPNIDSDQGAPISTTARRKNAIAKHPWVNSTGICQTDPYSCVLRQPENDISTSSTGAAKSKFSRLDVENPWLPSDSNLSDESIESSNNINLQNFAECITILLRNGAEPWRAMPVPLWFRTVEWWYGQQGYLRYEERIRDYPAMAAIYYQIIHSLYPETTVSIEGDIFWDAKQEVEGPAYGSSFLLPIKKTRTDK